MNGKTTYPKAKLAEIKRNSAKAISTDVLIDIKMDTHAYEMSLGHATSAAKYEVNMMTTRQIYSFLRDNGFTFDSARACWQAVELATN